MSGFRVLPVLLCLSLLACRPQGGGTEVGQTVPVASPEEGGAVSTAPVPLKKEEAARREKEKRQAKDAAQAVDWSPRELEPGIASISCSLDYAAIGDGEPLQRLDEERIYAALAPCKEKGVLRLRYVGKINPDFTALMQRVSAVAGEIGIGKRVLDIDSSGGIVEEAIKAGDLIAGTGWTEWVRDGAVCHSACVLILAAGDVRLVSGRVGIHRIIRMSSTATTRAELNSELRVVYQSVLEYLERNGAAVAVADMMMAVPNRNLRLLTADELRQYGLDGVNPIQDDLDRLRVMRKCGEDFLVRRDAFVRAFDARCRPEQAALEAMNDCGLELRPRFGFPDAKCPDESPLSEFDSAATPRLAAGVPPIALPVTEETAAPAGEGK
ncbi:hypothetical protein GCM10027084_08460 [Pseudoxanthomonas sangjuensis]|uniref:COG3904 family protein n=1 Tax=Pseudoxanthomonas sangjuensis TaxID=1503750 RepID=UPI003CCDC9C6|nr:hypothetical protein CSC71_03465 [Pseudoxanthomonas sangjuensis]